MKNYKNTEYCLEYIKYNNLSKHQLLSIWLKYTAVNTVMTIATLKINSIPLTGNMLIAVF